jgi:hypothetical protein
VKLVRATLMSMRMIDLGGEIEMIYQFFVVQFLIRMDGEVGIIKVEY